MNKFTPGPWKIIPGFSQMKVYCGKKYEGHVCIADCHQFDIANDQEAARIEKEANAKLIAAAPMMLEALEAVAPFLHWLDQEQGIHLAGDMLHGNILEAIKAAKGKI